MLLAALLALAPLAHALAPEQAGEPFSFWDWLLHGQDRPEAVEWALDAQAQRPPDSWTDLPLLDWLLKGWDNQRMLPEPTPTPPPMPTIPPDVTGTPPPKPTLPPTDAAYDLQSGALTFSDIDFTRLPYTHTFTDLLAQLMQAYERFDRQIPLRFSSLTLDDLRRGMSAFDWRNASYRYSDAAGGELYVLVSMEYPAGARVAQAYLRGSTEGLTDRERLVYDQAAAFMQTEYPWYAGAVTRERSLHDLICRLCTYWTDGGNYEGSYTDFRSAIGVFVDGHGNCMAYSDAFTMLARMAGFRAFTVSGSAASPGEEAVAHAWNVIEVDGSWYFMDVTFNDMEHERFDHHYVYFNIGSNLMQYSHSWDDALLFVPVQAEIDARYAYGNPAFGDLVRAGDNAIMQELLMQKVRDTQSAVVSAMCDTFTGDVEQFVDGLVKWIALQGVNVSANYTPLRLGDTLYLTIAVDKR